MEKTAHTPGPWANYDGQILCENLNQYGNWTVAIIGREMTPEDHANADLIAAAPETASELKEIKERLEQLGGIGEVTVLGMIDRVYEAKERAEKAEARIAELKSALEAAEPHLRSGDEAIYRRCQMARYGLGEEDIMPMHLCI